MKELKVGERVITTIEVIEAIKGCNGCFLIDMSLLNGSAMPDK